MGTKNPSQFGLRLKELRVGAGLSQAQLAERAGLHLHGLTKLEQGDREPSWATVTALADALGVSCEALREPPAGDVRQQRGRPAKPVAEPTAPKRPRGRPRKGG